MTKDAADCKDTGRLIATLECMAQSFEKMSPCPDHDAAKWYRKAIDALEAMQQEKETFRQGFIQQGCRVAELEGLLRTLRYLPINRDRDTLEGYAGAVREITRQGLGMPALKGDNDEWLT